MTASVYSALAGRLKTFRGETYKLHVGDTWMEPAVSCRMQDLTVEEHPGMHRYASIKGRPELVEAICTRFTARTGLATTPDEVLVGAGATGALASVIRAIMAPGQEVLLLAPYWPLVSGIVTSFYGTPIPVPFFGTWQTPAEAVAAGGTARADDNEDSLKTRLMAYYKQTSPLVGYYYAKGDLKSVDGLASMDEVAQSISAALE